jgi:hypothetical protein
MTKLISSLAIVIVGLAALALAGPALTRLIHSLVPLIVAGGIVAAMLRVVWAYTRRW